MVKTSAPTSTQQLQQVTVRCPSCWMPVALRVLVTRDLDNDTITLRNTTELGHKCSMPFSREHRPNTRKGE